MSADGLSLLEPVFIWHALMTPGPIARRPEDLALVLRILSGPEGCDAAVPRVPWQPASNLDFASLRVAWSSLDVPLEDSVRTALQDVVGIADDSGARIGEARPAGDLAELLGLVDEIFMQLVTAFNPPTEGGLPLQPSRSI